jgi:uncharacterized protein YeeX (DUF496 family)
MDKKDLKIEALRQRIAELTVQYEDRVSDLRVDFTLVSQELEELKKEHADVEVAKPDSTDDAS